MIPRPGSVRLVSFLHHHRIAATLLAVGFSAAMLLLALRLEVDNSLEVFFVEDDPALQSYFEFTGLFGSHEVVVTAIHGEVDALHPDRLARLARLTSELATIEGVERVVSLASFLRQMYERQPLLGFVGGGSPAARLRASLEQDGLASRLVSEDGRTTLVLTWLEPGEDIDHRRASILAAIRSAVEGSLEVQEEASYGGVGVVHEGLNQATISDGGLFVVLSYLIIVLMFALVMRRWVWTLLAVGVVTLAAISTLGSMWLLGRPLTVMTMSVPSLVMVLGVANVLHMARHLEHASASADARLPGNGRSYLVLALAAIAWPCLFNTLSTAGGFLSLTTASLAVTRDYGLFAAIGITYALLFALVGMAALVPYAAKLPPRQPQRELLARAAERMVRFGLRYRGGVLAGTALLVLVTLYGISQVVIDTYSIGMLPDDHPVEQDSRRIEAATGPYMPLEFLIRVPEPEAWKEPAFISGLLSAARAIEADTTLGPAASVGDLLRETRLLTSGAPVPRDWAPASLEETERLLGLAAFGAANGELAYLVHPESQTLRFTVTLPMTTGRGLIQRTERIEEILEASLPQGTAASASGYLPLYGVLSTRIVSDQARSLALALVVAFGLVALILRSGWLTLAAIPPNLLPILAVLGLMGFSGIYLDLATVTVATAVIGIVVDDTIHLLYRLRSGLEAGLPFEEAMLETARTSGTAVLSTSIIFCAGFGVLALASVRSVGYVGLLTSTAVFTALLTDLLLLPAFASLLYQRRTGSAVTPSRHVAVTTLHS